MTLAIDEETLARVREVARRRGTSLDQMVRAYLQELVSEGSPQEIAEELEQLWSTSSGNSGRRPGTREELHERTES